ncbi:Cof-type HAD-IIB family hydrolase [Borborobacter arsenicus]|nr:Cof-type HAD-IIB family hydrolase [Pseudaminobacter arsenicus]
MRQPISLIALDVDRTTLTDDYRLLPAVVEAVARAAEADVQVVAATARAPNALRDIAAALGLRGPSVCLNGAWTGTILPDEAVMERGVAMDLTRTKILIAEAEAAGLNPCWFTEAGWHALSEGHLVEREARATQTEPVLTPSLECFGEPVFKVLCLETERSGDALDRLMVRFTDEFSFVRSDRHLIEITANGVSKQGAIAALTRRLGVDRESVAAIGDSENDLDLIRWAGFGVAMGNGTEVVKRAADWVTWSNAHAGAAFAIDTIIAANRAAICPAGIRT